jgi:hypothetical protein
MLTTIQRLLRTGLKILVENGQRNGPIKMLRDGLERTAREEDRSGMNHGTRKSNALAN